MHKSLLFCCLFFTSILTLSAQDIVDVNLNIKHAVNGVSELDRSKFLMVHAGVDDGEWGSEALKKEFLIDYDTYLGRNNGSLPWNLSICEEDPSKPGWPSVSYLQTEGAKAIVNYKNKTSEHSYENRISRYMMGGQEGMYPNGTHEINPQKNGLPNWIMAKEGYNPLAEFYANYFKYFFGNGGTTGQPLPTYIEVMNEPFVKSGSLGTTNANLSEMHKVVAKRIKALNPSAKVGGYSAAHPAYESNDFGHWDSNWKTFIDIAGEDMDFFSLHLYDNIQKNPEEGVYRAGSNVEAILDMVEHYQYLKLGKIKPWCLSEYGCLNTEGDPYTKERDWNNLRSFSTMIMQFLERPDLIDQALPFFILKANGWGVHKVTGEQYAHRLFRQKKELAGETGEEWVFTELVKFYQLWAKVKGTRVDTKSSNLDTQIDTYVNGNKAFVIINNMHHEARTVNLNVTGFGDAQIQSIISKHLHAENSGIPALDEITYTSAINKINIGREATIILEYTFDKAVSISETEDETKYYADIYNQIITANQTINFNINNVQTGTFGEAILRMGVGRNHGLSLKPTIKVNGTTIEVPENWRGDIQKNRDLFFGVLEIPVPYNLIKTANTIAISFSDNGGRVSSLSMQVFNFSKQIVRSKEQLATDNFKIQSVGETCPNKKNGKITVTALKNITYEAKLLPSNTIKTFTENTTFETLAPGAYELCITTPSDPSYKQCFTITIDASTQLKVSSKVSEDKSNIIFNLEGGSSYTITRNNEAFKTRNASIEIPLVTGTNTFEIQTEKDCQGIYFKEIISENELTIYPNPSSSTINISTGTNSNSLVNITIISSLGTVVYSKDFNNPDKTINLDINTLNTGIYIIKVTTDNSTKQQKFIKN